MRELIEASVSEIDTLLGGAAIPTTPTLPEYIWLGVYPQNDASGNQKEPVKWKRLTTNGTEALYISE